MANVKTKTVSIGVENLCVPCGCRCRYCLLAYDGKELGVAYDRGKRFAQRCLGELAQVRPDLGRFYYIGYCMDTPVLADYIKFCQRIGSPAGTFLQLNGLALRDGTETERFIDMIAGAGIRSVDMTFYGQEACHDRFAGRSGDFAFLLRLMEFAVQAGIQVDVSLPIIRENMGQAEGLLDALSKYPVKKYFAFLPHSKGRGRTLDSQRLTRAEFDALPKQVRGCFSPKVEYRSEGEWLRTGNWPQPEERTLTLSLTPENIDRLEQMTAEEIVAMLETLDDQNLAAMPSPAELAEMYGDPSSQKMYRRRDLLLEWRQRYLGESGADIPNMDDERGHFSVRDYD